MDLVRSLAELEQNTDLHAARLLVLISEFAGADGTGHVEGLTKLAKLDFLLRYPVMLTRALAAKGKPTESVQLQEFEQRSVESKMVRYRFGPWDHRYRLLLNTLIARGLATVTVEGRTLAIGITPQGTVIASSLARDGFIDVARRAKILRRDFDIKATHLMKFVYATFPELLSMRQNEVIDLET
jgi:hypothetical protein